MEQIVHMLTWDDCAVHGQLSSSGSCETQGRESTHSTWTHFMQAWAMEPGQRILNLHGDSQQVADCLTKIMAPRAAHPKTLGL